MTLYYAADLALLFIYGNNKPQGNYWFTSSNTLGEARLKKAATRKLNKMILNAHELNNFDSKLSDSTSLQKKTSSRVLQTNDVVDQTMLNYVLNGQTYEAAGGLMWTWKLLLSGALFDTEGIWLPTRMIVFQGVQILVGIVLTLIYITLTRYAADEAEKAQDSLPEDLPKWARQ